MKYKHLFFDLDRTLWDFDHNTHQALLSIYHKYNLSEIIGNADLFINIFRKHNEQMWNAYRRGDINKTKLREARFYKTLLEFNINDSDLAIKMDNDYISISPNNTVLIPHATDILEYLYKRYNLFILTNGFKESQIRKLQNSKIFNFFKEVFTSDGLQALKPNNKIFHLALSSVNAKKNESIMIGDDLYIDIIGAREYGIDQVYFNPYKNMHNEKVTYEISSLDQLKEIF